MRMIDPADIAAEQSRQQLLLMCWFSPSFPIGAFAFSHGLEWAYESGAVANRDALTQWLADLVTHGSARTDAILTANAWRAAHAKDHDTLNAIIALGAALQPSRERALEATVQGRAFWQLITAAYPRAGVCLPETADIERLTLSVAVGIAAAAHRLALQPLLTASIGGFVANLVSASVRLGIVGQTDGQRVIADLMPTVAKLAQEAIALTLDDLGSSTLRSDLFSLQHETQYSRLFRS